MNAEARLQELGLTLPVASKPKGLYRPLVLVGDLAFTSGHLPFDTQGHLMTGRVGADVDLSTAAEAARRATLGILATLRAEFGSLDQVRRLIKLTGIVCCTPEFDQQPAVINGASQLIIDLFGLESGMAARTALGTHALPLGAVVEIEAIFQYAS